MCRVELPVLNAVAPATTQQICLVTMAPRLAAEMSQKILVVTSRLFQRVSQDGKSHRVQSAVLAPLLVGRLCQKMNSGREPGVRKESVSGVAFTGLASGNHPVMHGRVSQVG